MVDRDGVRNEIARNTRRNCVRRDRGVGRCRCSEPGTPYARSLRPKLEALVKEMLVPGAVVVVRSEKLGDWRATFGTQKRGGEQRVAVDDHIRIGSNTKTMTGTVVLQLVQEGKLRLDDPVSKYRRDVPNGETITIEHLLSMRSGLYNYHRRARVESVSGRDA